MGRDKQEEISKGLRRPKRAVESGGSADWCSVDADLLRDLIAKASHRGGALRFGYTRDGGAYAIGVYYGPDYWTDYLRPGEDIDAYLRDLISSFEDSLVVPREESKSRKRT